MKTVDFTAEHVEQAACIARQNYEAERGYVPMLPSIGTIPDLIPFAENGLGVAAFEGSEMVGFLCCVSPFQNAFHSTDAVGVFSPMGTNGTLPENRAEIYARMYQAAAKKWAKAGASSHAICLYAHDTIAQEQFFRYGFGLRCIDAIRGMDEIEVQPCHGFSFKELTKEEYPLILPLNKLLVDHCGNSPSFMCYPSINDDELLKKVMQPNARYFVALSEGKIIAYVKIIDGGENFACDDPHMKNVCGAFCLPEYRGTGIYQNLMNILIRSLKAEGYTRLGVDFESINPTAYGFWLKYFTAYTHGVVRRVDEYALKR